LPQGGQQREQPKWGLPVLFAPSSVKVYGDADSDRPSRFDAQSDAVGLIFSAKTNANPESSVGLMSMAGNGPTVLTTLTTDMGKILDGLHRTKIDGYSDFTLSLNIAAVCTSLLVELGY
jgi:hypothetical protein